MIPQLSAKTVARDVLIIFALTAIAGFFTSLAMPGKLGTPEHTSVSALLSLILGTLGFTLVACFSPAHRWYQLLVVGVLGWILGGIINITFFGAPFTSWLTGIFYFIVTIPIAGAFSYLFKGSKPPTPIDQNSLPIW